MYALASWRGGLSTILSSPNLNLSRDLLKRLLKAAITMGNLKSIEVLLNYEVPITRETWDDITYCFLKFESHDRQAAFLLTKIYRHIASHLYQDHNAGSDDQINTRGFESVNITEKTSSLYHNTYLTLLSAESAWQAGHRGVESIGFISNSWWRQEDRIGTTFWAQAISWMSGPMFNSEFLATFRWLMGHGADPFWVHPIHLTTPAHMFVRNIPFNADFNSDHREDILMLLSSQFSDNCQCYCSQDGCSVIGCAISSQFGKHCYDFSITGLRKYQAYLFRLVNNNHNDSWIASAILRVLTFDNLSLTHTCCYRIYEELLDHFTRTTPEEAEEIHDLERDDIELLDRVVAELEEKWAGYKKPFVTFMNRVWRPRMRKMRLEQQVDQASYEAELVRIGVKLKEPNEKTNLEIDSDEESDASWPDDYEDSDSEGWYTTDEEDADEVEDHGEGSS